MLTNFDDNSLADIRLQIVTEGGPLMFYWICFLDAYDALVQAGNVDNDSFVGSQRFIRLF